MDFRTTIKYWDYLAHKDPLWAILSEPSKKNNRWQIDEFLAHGSNEICNTLRFLTRIGATPVDFESALDFGCGVGRLTRPLANHFTQVVGVDASPTMLSQARELHSATSNIEFVLNETPDLRRFADDSVSFLYSALVLQHITYPESLGYVREFLRIVKPGGIVFFQTPTLDRTPLPIKIVRAGVRRTMRRLRVPFERFYIHMNAIPFAELSRAASDYQSDIVLRINTNRQTIDGEGRLVPKQSPWFERLVSESIVIRKRKE